MPSKSSFTGRVIVAFLGISMILVACSLVFFLTRNKSDGRGTVGQDPGDQGGVDPPEYGDSLKLAIARAKMAVPKPAVGLSAADGRERVRESGKGVDDNAALRAPSGQEIVDLQQSVFSGEARDPSWSDKASHQVAAALTGHLPEGSSLKSVECRTTMCSLELQYRDTDSYHEFVRSTLLGADTGLWGGAFSAIITKADDGDVRARVFLAREGQGLPQPQPESAN